MSKALSNDFSRDFHFHGWGKEERNDGEKKTEGQEKTQFSIWGGCKLKVKVKLEVEVKMKVKVEVERKWKLEAKQFKLKKSQVS